MNKNRNIEIIEDIDGTKIVKIDEIRFRGKRNIDWGTLNITYGNMLGIVISLVRIQIKYTLEQISPKSIYGQMIQED